MQNLNDLAYFVAVVAHQGFSPAARALGLPKSSLSRRVARLEERLGVRLLERSTHRFAVTEAGEAFHRHAQAAMAEAEAADDSVALLRAEPQGRVRCSCPDGLARGLAPVFSRFLADHPRVSLQLLATNRRVDLIEEGVDIAIRVRERLDTDATLQMRQVGSSWGWLVATPALLDRIGRPGLPADLRGLPTLGMSEQRSMVSWALTGPQGQRETIDIEPRLATGEFELLLQAALDGIGIGLLPDLLCTPALQEGRLERILPGWSSLEGIIHLVFTTRRGLLPAVRALIDTLVTTLPIAVAAGGRMPPCRE
ncbi:MAG TPA: LysR substrate-binding domain-containing protein [Roseomonas sp.]|jgi:DNA-binding transcriptional LysR family regulator